MQVDKPEENITLNDVRDQAPARKSQSKVRIAAIAFVVTGVAIMSGLVPRLRARSVVRTETADMAVPYVSVVQPTRGDLGQEVVLPANVQPYASSPIYARTNGYLKKWYVDIGAHVKKGQLLAEIDAPEVDQQAQQARANLATAEANLQLSETTAKRYTDLLKTNSVAQQDTDNAVGALKANQATVRANQANVAQLEQLQSYEKVYAPFDGVISVRNTDVGYLINAGSNGGTQTALFQIVQPNKLRVYASVPEAYSQAAKPGLTAELSLSEFPGRRFTGRLVRTADAIDQATRTLNVEIDVANPTGTLFAGSYAEVHLKIPVASAPLILPIETLLFRRTGLHVATVTNGQVVIKTVTPGHDFGDRIEIVGGLNGDESVILNPPDSIATGAKVRIADSTGGTQPNGAQGVSK